MDCAAWKRLALLLALALAVRVAAGVYWQSRLDRLGVRFAMGDSDSYWVLGRAIALGEPYRCGPEHALIFRTPGYPLLLAPLLRLCGGGPPVLWARIESAVFGTLAVGGVWWLARALFDARAGWVAGVVAAFYPESVASSAFVLSEAPFGVLMLLQLALWTVAWRGRSPRRTAVAALLAGVVAGAATLVRPSWLLFVPFGLGVGLLMGGRGAGSPDVLPRPRWRHAWIAAATLAGMIVAMAPWWIRNARLAGRFVPTTLQVGASLYDGLNPRATGASNMDLMPPSVEELRRRMAAGEAARDIAGELELDRRYRVAALAFAREQPGRVVRLAAVKVRRMWNLWPNEADFSSWPVRLAVASSYLPVLVLGAIGAARTLGRGWPYILCWLPAVYFTLLHAAFVSSIRYRQPAMLGLIVLAAGAVAGWNGTVPFGGRRRVGPDADAALKAEA